MIFQLFKFTD